MNLQPPQPWRSAEAWHKPAFIVFLVVWAANEALLLLAIDSRPLSQWPEALLLVSALLSSLVALARRLPVQNVAMTALLIAAISSTVLSVGIISGIPFGPILYSEQLGEKILTVLPWPLPLIWIVVIINARGVARLIMRPWRKTNYYGFWVIGLACALALLFDLNLEPFAVQVKQYWMWLAPATVWDWCAAPWADFLGWFVTSLGILAFTTPWLINKNPVKKTMDYQPLVLWVLLNSWLITGNALHGVWWAAGLGLAGKALATVFAIRGARW